MENIKHLKFNSDEELIQKTPNTLKNNSATEADLELMKIWFKTFAEVEKFNASSGLSEEKIREAENRLEITIPSTLRLLYSFCGNEEKALSSSHKHVDCRILNLDELKVEKNVVIYDGYSGEALYETDILTYSVDLKGKSIYSIDLIKDWHLDFYKKWYWKKDHFPLTKNLLILPVCNAITHKNNVFKTKVKGLFSYDPIKPMDEKMTGYLERFQDFEHYYHTIYFSKQKGALGWFRSGSAIPDLYFGCDDKSFVDEIIAKFDFTKAKFDKYSV